MSFNDDAHMGIRDIAWFCEAADTQVIGGTHTVKSLVDWRTEHAAPYFGSLIRGLGRYYIGELT